MRTGSVKGIILAFAVLLLSLPAAASAGVDVSISIPLFGLDNKMAVTLDQSAKDFLVDKGFDQKYGARPLKRAIQKYVEDPLAEEILRGSFKDGAKIIAKHFENTDHIIFIDEDSQIDIPDKAPESAGSEES